MRRKTSFLASLALAATTLTIPATAHADVTDIALTTAFDRLAADRVFKMTLNAESASGITDVRANVRHQNSSQPIYTTLPFTRVAGTGNDGTWEAEFRPDIRQHPQQNVIEVLITSGDGLTERRWTSFRNCYESVIADFDYTPKVVDFDHSALTVRGRVMMQKTRDTAPAPVPDALVQVPGTHVRTGPDGSFASTWPRASNAFARVGYQGLLCGVTKSGEVTVTRQSTETTAQLVQAQPVALGSQVTVRGKVLRRAAGGLLPAPDVPVKVVASYRPTGGKEEFGGATTASDGTFELSFPVKGAAVLDVETEATTFFEGSRTTVGDVNIVRAAKITGFNADPEPLAYGGPILTRGTLTTASGEPITGVPVILEYSGDGKTGWRTLSTDTTSATGEFFMSPRRITRDGHWRTRFAGNATYAPAVSWVDHVDVKYRTYLYSFNASPEPVKKGKTITVKGELQRFMDRVLPSPGATIYIYFKHQGATTWKQMAVTRTGSDGRFTKTFTASKDGTWMATYKGSTAYIKSNAPTDYVDVR